MITMSYIKSIAPNPKSLSSAKAVVGKLSDPRADAEGARLRALCSGSAARPYEITVGLRDTFSYKCTCPSRLSPCKHVLALLMLYLSSPGSFSVCPSLPELSAPKPKRDATSHTASPETDKRKNALRLRGLKAARRLYLELLGAGLGRHSILPGLLEKSAVLLQSSLKGLHSSWAFIIYTLMGDGEDRLRTAFEALVKYGRTLDMAEEYCLERSGNPELPPDPRLESLLGAALTLNRLESLGQVIENAELLQLSFSAGRNNAARVVEETGIWLELGSGRLFRTQNLRPFSALSKTRETDSAHDAFVVPRLCLYPLGGRVRWRDFSCRPVSPGDLARVLSCAGPGGQALLDDAGKHLSDPLEASPFLSLVNFDKLAFYDGRPVILDKTGMPIPLSAPGSGELLRRLPLERFDAALLSLSATGGLLNAAALCLAGKDGLYRLDVA